MKKEMLFLVLVVVVSIFLVGCGQKSDYSAYNQPQGQQQQYVGGGCGVATQASYEDTPVGAFDSVNTQL
ncbi:MAG TPA: hypothetical protein VJI97_00895 [Candidatus Nanoarchaeia archaeon]|nr:hypothetical protein [Candidatus Nanoarchaeia archaeon]